MVSDRPKRWIRAAGGAAVLLTLAVGRAGTLAGPALDDPAVFAHVVALGEAALPDLATALRGPRPDLAVKALGQIKRREGAALLLPVAEAPDAELRAAVAWALGECGMADDAVGGTLAVLAADPYPRARAEAVRAAVILGLPKSDEIVRRAIADADCGTRLATVRAIAGAHRTGWHELLTSRLDYSLETIPDPEDHTDPPRTVTAIVWTEPVPQVRLATIRALGALQVPDSLPALIAAMEREDSYNRLAVIEAIQGMGAIAPGVCLGRIVPIAVDQDSIRHHLPVLVNNGALAVIAGQLGDPRCTPYLLEVLRLPREELGTDKDLTELYIQAVQLLGRFRVKRAARPLAVLLKETRVRQLSDALQEALRQIGHAAARPLARNLDDWEMAPVFLRLLSEEQLRTPIARDKIVGYLLHESDEIRLAATDALGTYLAAGILDEYDLPLLEAMYADPSAEVRARCEHWTRRIRDTLDSGGAP